MSCVRCEKIQNHYMYGDSYPSQWRGGMTYFRVGKANLMVIGCDTHLRQLQKIIRQSKEVKK